LESPLLQPNPPKHLLERVSGSPSQADFLNSFEHLRYAIKTYLTEAGLDFSRFADILDFGCGVGRFAFAFEPEFRNGQRLWGCDVFEECARWCHDHIDFAEIRHTNLKPPLPYGDEQFDLAYALSVFTHLRLDLQFTWVWELHRLLRPGGIVFATFHGPLFMPLLYQTVLNTAGERALYSVGNEGLFA
jgi:SAM-dependent methyltransferase